MTGSWTERIGLALAGATAAALAVATVSWTPATEIRVADEDGAPAAGTYVRYHFKGEIFNPVHPVTYVAEGSVIARADKEGRVRIPGRLHLRSPLPLSSPPRLVIDHVYVPRLHNAFGPVAAAVAVPDVFAADSRLAHVRAYDLAGDPERWARSLGVLFDCIRDTLAPVGSIAAAAADDVRTRSHARELAGHLRREHAAFVARHGQTLRQLPPPPSWQSEDDRRVWQQAADAQLAREPLWGPFIERTWRRRLAALKELELAVAP